MSHSRLQVLVSLHQFLSPICRLLRTSFPMSSITSSGSERSPVMVRAMCNVGASMYIALASPGDGLS